jgi:Protein of unknown function, DUF547
MKRALLLSLFLPVIAAAQEPNYAEWNRILKAHYDPARGMDYRSLKAKDANALQSLRQQLGRVNVSALDRKQHLAYWINVYNVNVVATVVERYPVDSIRDISTDPIVRLNVFKKERVPFGGELLSLDDVEHKKIREAFKDARIHFAINCAAKGCPPIRPEAFTGARVDAQLDDQARKFLAKSVRYERDGGELTLHVTKIMDWFGDDFDNWAGGRVAFLRKYVPADKQRLIAQAKDVELEYDDYDWALNDWRR